MKIEGSEQYSVSFRKSKSKRSTSFSLIFFFIQTTDETRFSRSDVESTVPSTTLRISVRSNEAIQNALLTVHVHSPLCAQPNEIRLGHIGGQLKRHGGFESSEIAFVL